MNWEKGLLKGRASGITLTLLLIGMLTSLFNIQTVRAEPKTWTVDDDGPADFSKIQDAINAASDGDTVFVANGTYYEDVVVNKKVSLIGESKTTTIIDGNGTGTVVHVTANMVFISNFTIRNSGSSGLRLNADSGLRLDASYCNIRNNLVTNNDYGIYLDHSEYNTLANNTVTDNAWNGILLYCSDFNTLINNTVTKTKMYGGICLDYSGDNTLINNTAANNSYNFYVWGGSSDFRNYVGTDNTVDGKPIYYLVDAADLVIDAQTNAGTVYLFNCTNITIRDLTLRNNGQGVFLVYTTKSKVENVTTINNRQSGILLLRSSGNTITNNTATYTYRGIDIYMYSKNNTIANNTVTNNGFYGITVSGSSNNIVADNTVANNYNGIPVWHSENNVFRRNSMTGNRYDLEVFGSPLSCYINDIDTSNTINGKPVQYLINQNNLTIDPSTFPDVGYLGIVNSTKVKVKNLNLTKNGQGLLFAYTNDSSIMNMNVSNNKYGIHLAHSRNNILSDVTIDNSTERGIYLESANNNIVSDVTIGNSQEYVFYFESANNNTIYHNNFINNTQQTYFYNSFDNKWDNDYPFGGNFWSNYAGVDLYYGVNQDKPGSDGIGDTPLTIDANNIDAYPLMGPFGPLTMKGEKSTVFPSGDVGLIFENVVAEGSTTADKAVFGPEPPSGFELVGEYYDIKTTASYSGKIETRIIYGDSGMTQEEEEGLQLMQWNETSQQWINTTTRIDTQSNVIYGETSHLSMFGVTRCSVPLPPVANFTWSPYIPEVGKSVTFDASSSTPNGGEIVSYKWNFGDDHYDSGEIVSHTYTSSGTYTVTLNVTDSEGLWDTAQKQIRIVQPHGPEAEFEAIPDTALTGDTIKLDASASLPGWNGTHEMPIVEYRWDFGGAIKITTSTPIFYYSFISPGIYYVTLTVYAPGATPETDTTSRKVTIIPVPIGGYSLPIRRYTTTKPLMPYMILVAILTSIFATIRRETHRRTKPRNAK